MIENKQQTAVGYYSNKIGRLTSDLVTGKITGKQFVMLEIKLLDTAKKMDREQRLQDMSKMQIISDVSFDGDVEFMFKPIEYYAEKYGKTFLDLVSDEESKVHEVVRKLKERGNK
jgi:hypothetical protein